MNVAIIGTGNIAKTHANAIRYLGHNIVSAVNKNIESAKAFAKKWNIPDIYTNIDDALESSNIDIVHICTPPTLHYSHIKSCLMAGKHVISEKPLCLDEKEAMELSNIAREKNLINAVCFNNRFYLANKIAKNELNSQSIRLIHGSYLQSFHCLPSEYSWRFDEKIAGNMRAVTEIGSHIIDLLLFLTGKKITKLSSLFIKANKIRTVKDGLMYADNNGKLIVNSEDAAVVNMILENGIIANIVLSEISHGKTNELKYTIDCDNKSVCWNSEDPYKINISDKISSRTSTNAFSVAFNETFIELISNVYDSIYDAGCREYANFEDASYTVKVCNAIYKSANNNGEYINI